MTGDARHVRMPSIAVLAWALAIMTACAGKVEGGPEGHAAQTYGALDVADGTCAPVVGRSFDCAKAPSLDGVCAAGTKPVAHVLKSELAGGATGMSYTCTDASGAFEGSGGTGGSGCMAIGDLYANAYEICARGGFVLASFNAAGACPMATTACSVVVTCCPE